MQINQPDAQYTLFTGLEKHLGKTKFQLAKSKKGHSNKQQKQVIKKGSVGALLTNQDVNKLGGFGFVINAVCHMTQRLHLQHFDFFAIHQNNALLLQPRKNPRHGFNGQA